MDFIACYTDVRPHTVIKRDASILFKTTKSHYLPVLSYSNYITIQHSFIKRIN